MLDLRIAYVTLSALGIYFLFNIKQLIIGKNLKEIVVNISYIFIIPFAVIGFYMLLDTAFINFSSKSGAIIWSSLYFRRSGKILQLCKI